MISCVRLGLQAVAASLLALCLFSAAAWAADRDLSWESSSPLLAPAKDATDSCYSVKDPTVVFHEGRWHVFVTVRGQKRSHQIEYISFRD